VAVIHNTQSNDTIIVSHSWDLSAHLEPRDRGFFSPTRDPKLLELPRFLDIIGGVTAAAGTGMAASAKEYRANAEECIGWARTARTDKEREIFLQIARTWMEAVQRFEGTPTTFIGAMTGGGGSSVDTKSESLMRNSRVRSYRVKAEACSHQASREKDAGQKDRWLQLSAQWMKLAEDENNNSPRVRAVKYLRSHGSRHPHHKYQDWRL
jgi:hypothetical protein